jgi:hypothetical protein
MDELDYQQLPLTRAARETLKKLDAKRIQQFRDRILIDPAGLDQHIQNELIRGRLRDYWACLQESPGTPDDRLKLLREFAERPVYDDVTIEALATIDDASERKNADLVYTYNAAPLPDPANHSLTRMNPNIDQICREIEAQAADVRLAPCEKFEHEYGAGNADQEKAEHPHPATVSAEVLSTHGQRVQKVQHHYSGKLKDFYLSLGVSRSEFFAWRRKDRRHCGKNKKATLDQAADALSGPPK